MGISEELFFDLVLDRQSLKQYSANQLANIYVKSALTNALTSFILEQFWLEGQQDSDLSFEDFIQGDFSKQVQDIKFLENYILSNGKGCLKKLGKDSLLLESSIIEEIKKCSGDQQRVFLKECFDHMLPLFIREEKNDIGPRLYRTFDSIDHIFNFNYLSDRELSVPEAQMNSSERLYIGSGVGVQSGYSNLLLAFHSLALEKDAKVIDLGSGYGRVGLVFSILNPELAFVGYEFVKNRVDVSNKATSFLNLEKGLNYKVQDLSDRSFDLPIANVYYLYDPFTEDTYKYIIKKIIAVGQKQKVSVVTKGNARDWFFKVAKEESWKEPIKLDGGNLCIFNSQ